MQMFPATEGFIPFHGYRTWYRIVGNGEEPGKLPLLVLHGGPGASYDYLEPLEAMTTTGRRVIFYDQLGGGNSDHPHDPSLWTVELFVEELDAVRKALALDRLHLLGQSWGGMLGDEATPIIVETIHRTIPGSEWIIFENSSHMPHVEETDLYLQVLNRFLTRVEGANS
jgi:pimeloyl-ACP methyl ester carboxylesterase